MEESRQTSEDFLIWFPGGSTERKSFQQAFNESKQDTDALLTLEGQAVKKARELESQRKFAIAADLFLLVEEIKQFLGLSANLVMWARECAADALSKAKEWGLAGPYYRGVFYESRRSGEFDDELMLQYWKLKSAERNFLRMSKRWGRWLTYWFWGITSGFGTSYYRLLCTVLIVLLIWAHLFAFGTVLTGGLFISGKSFVTYLDHIYFSVVVFSSLGFGDFWPIHPAAKILVVIEVLLGMVSLGLFVSILSRRVTLFTTVDLSLRRRWREARSFMKYSGTPRSKEYRGEDIHDFFRKKQLKEKYQAQQDAPADD